MHRLTPGLPRTIFSAMMLLLFTQGCAILPMAQIRKQATPAGSRHDYKGTFEDRSEHDNVSLYTALTRDEDVPYDPTHRLMTRLEAKEGRLFSVSLYDEGRLVKSAEVSMNFREGFLIAHRQWYIGVFIVFNGISSRKRALGLTDSGDLKMFSAWGGFICFLALPQAIWPELPASTYIFKRRQWPPVGGVRLGD